MTYIELINNFWSIDEDWQFTCCETRLYFYLLKTANRLGWVDSWARSDTKVSSDVGVSVNSMKTARNRLVQAGLVEFKSGGKGQRDKTRYQIRCHSLIPKPQPNLIPNLIPKRTPKHTPYINKTKEEDKEINTPIPPRGEIKEKKKSIGVLAKAIFLAYYLEKFGQPYYWQAKDAGGMKQLLDKIKFSRGSKQTPLPVDDDSLLSALPLFLNSVNDPWLLEHFSVPILNSKYNEIVTNASKTRKQNASTGMILTDNSTDKYDTEEERKLRARFS